MSYIPPPKKLGAGSLVDCYLRDSGGEGQDRSVASQLIVITEYFKQYRLTLRRVYKDVAKSGKNIAARDDFNRMIADYENGDAPQGLIIWDYARFARNSKEAVYNIATIERSGAVVHSITDDVTDGKYKELLRLVKHIGNEAEREKNSDAVKRELHQLVKNTKAMPGSPPRGLMREPLPPSRNERSGEVRTLHKWTPSPEIAPLVLRAFEMRAQNKTLREIMTATGLYKSITCFQTFWDNKIYKGVLEYGGMVIEDYCEPIVPPELWDAVNAMKKTRERKPGEGINDPRRVRSVYLLSGLVFCQQCGGALTGHTIKDWSYYICSQRRLSRGAKCNAMHIPKDQLERGVLEAVEDNALSLEVLINLQGRVTRELDRSQQDIQRARIKLDRDLVSAKKRIANLTNAIGEHGHNDSLIAALRDAEQSRMMIIAQIRQLDMDIDIPHRTNAQLKDIAEAISSTLANGTHAEKQSLIRTFITRIIARRDKATITALVYYLPIQIINPAERGILGQGSVPPRWDMTEALITITIPFTRKKYTRQIPPR